MTPDPANARINLPLLDVMLQNQNQNQNQQEEQQKQQQQQKHATNSHK